MKHALQTDKAKALVDAIKEAKLDLERYTYPRHEAATKRATDALREAEEAYADYIYSQRP